MSAILLLAVLGPALGSLALRLVASIGEVRADVAGRLAAASCGVAFVLAAAVAVAVATAGSTDSVSSLAPVGFTAGPLGVLFLLLVTGVTAVVQAFAVRYLRGDAGATRFAILAGLLASTTAATVTASTLIGLAVAWTATSVVLCRLLGLYAELPAARAGVRQAARAFAIGDAALWLGVLLATATWGQLDLSELASRAGDFASDSTITAVVGCLLVVAAAARSAQLPLHAWLPSSLAAPTPVSALLHAGVVNGGGMLLITLSPLFGASSVAAHLAFLVGAVTLTAGAALMLARPDVKGSLALSTVAQMGFMIMTCGLGAYAAAAFHLVAHGMYKASLFLGSGGAVARHVRHVHAPPIPAAPRAAARARAAAASAAGAAIAVPALALLAANAVVPAPTGAGVHGAAALLVFAWATAAWAGWRWLRTHAGPVAVATHLAVVVAATFAYVAAIHESARILAPALGGAGPAAASPWLLVPVLLALGLLSLVHREPRGAARQARSALYVAALNAGLGHGRPARLRARPRRATALRSPSLVFSDGSRP